jgi:hypothetical protein
MKNGQSRETGNIGYTRHRTKTNKTQNTTQKTNEEWTIQRNWKHWAHKTQDEDKQN